MKFESKEIVDGKTVITTTSRSFIFFKKVVKYEAQKEMPKGYWNWLELPGGILVGDVESLQLNAWNNRN